MRLSNIIKEKNVLLEMKAQKKEEALAELATHLKKQKLINHEKEIIEKLLQRETLGSTALGEGIAIPHCKAKGIKSPILMVGISRNGVNFEAPDGKPVKIFFLLITSPDDPSLNLQILALIAQLVKKSPELKSKLLAAEDAREALEIIREQEEKA
ncbi:MAG: PTS system, fructose-specific IIA component [Candidatus Saccharicenans subterraneus]|uniref:PTS system, fructose-specific IIA component n=1 Tax=Candidatus Saccharicenans subterraneus TaxID=2508984 RepID=A0A3E2BND9_9BACT|nr:MAG: PTS system, fructose-specific IIA component [Candidatus Saccharicenans subterraneum]